MADWMARACLLIVPAFVFCGLCPNSYAHPKSDMKASFNLQHDADTAMVTVRPSVRADESATLDYRIKIAKQGAAGTSTQGNGGRVDVIAGQDVAIGPVLRFGNFTGQDTLHLELRLCSQGSRCKHAEDVIASFTTSYPDENGDTD